VILGSVGAYSLAALSQTKDREIIETRMEELLRTILPIAIISLGFLGVLGRPLLSLLFSSEFQAAGKFLPILLTANFLQAAAWVLGAPLLGFGLIRTWTLIQLAGVALRYGLSVLLMPVIGAQAVPVGLLAAMAFDLLANVLVCRYQLGLKLQSRTCLKYVVGAAAITAGSVAGMFSSHPLAYLIAAVLVVTTAIATAWNESLAVGRAALRWRSALL
jgi:O-antigen/teichoic acid export membrane protein